MNVDHNHNRPWALVLAAGSGTRLHSLTTDAAGHAIPKQFCSLNGGPSLLRRTLHRAFRVAAPERTLVVVAEEHRRHWQRELNLLPAHNVIVQPRNRGTAIGIVLPLLHLLNRDPEANVVLLPSDHHIDDEDVFIQSIREALCHVRDDITLLGITPAEPDPELGYIVTRPEVRARSHSVNFFVEKSSYDAARRLIAEGALWNSFVVVAAAHAIVDAMHERHSQVVNALRCAADAPAFPVLLAAVYERLPALDFSRDLITPLAARVKCRRVPPCGWTDLGTPQRVAQCVSALPASRSDEDNGHRVVVDLAEAHRRRLRRPLAVHEPMRSASTLGEAR